MTLKEDLQPFAEKIVNFVGGLEYLLIYARAAEFVHKNALQVTINDKEVWVATDWTGERSVIGDSWLEAVQNYSSKHNK